MEPNGLIWIRTDANEEIASGHMMRCLTVAKELLRANKNILFLVSDKRSEDFLRGLDADVLHSSTCSSFNVLCLDTDFHNLDKECAKLLPLFNHFHPQAILVDSYFVTKSYLAFLESHCAVAYFDDMQSFDYPVTGVINYDLHPDISKYSSAKDILVGGKYSPLREQFTNTTYTPREYATQILLTTGGSDPYHITLEVLKQLCELCSTNTLSTCTYHVVVGAMNKDKETLLSLSQGYSNIHLYENVTDMAALMSSCDIAITAGGTTLYELSALGVPTICFSMADNQIGPATDFFEERAIHYIGDYRTTTDFYGKLFSLIAQLLSSYDMRLAQHQIMRNLVDGMGTRRIANYLCDL